MSNGQQLSVRIVKHRTLLILILAISVYGVMIKVANSQEVNVNVTDKFDLRIYYNGSLKPQTSISNQTGLDGQKSDYDIFTEDIINYVSDKLAMEPGYDQPLLNAPAITLEFAEKYITPPRKKRRSYHKIPESISRLFERFPKDNLSCQLSSPWLTMYIQREPNLKVLAKFNWHNRQFLIDQTLLSNPYLVYDFSPQELTWKTYSAYADEYNKLLQIPNITRHEILAMNTNIPEDLLWLFDRIEMNSMTFLAGLGPRLENHSATGYTSIVKHLVHQCFSADNNELQSYKTILDLDSYEALELLENYKINSLRGRRKN